MDISTAPLRVARPTRDLDRARGFWVDGLGLDVLWEADASAEGGHALLMVGAPGAAWHLELVADPEAHAASAPGPEHQLVVYLGEDETPLVARLLDRGGEQVPNANPYWERWGTTLEDPDGYRLVLCHRTWA